MKIDVKDNLTIQIYTHYFPSTKPIAGGTQTADGWYGAPSSAQWWEMISWCDKNGINCWRGRGTDVIFEREEDITAFMLRWS